MTAMTDTRLRFGIVGAGNIARAYGDVLPACGDVELVGVADPHPEAAAALAGGLRGRAFDTHRSMAAAVQLDAAIICTPPASHAEIVCDLTERGVHVLCEKPFSVDIDGAHAMRASARRGGVLLAMATKYRFAAGVVAARELLERGELGDLTAVENAFAAHVVMTGRWYADARISGGGVLMDNGPHSVDLMRWLIGPLTIVRASEGPRPQGLAVEENVTVEVRGREGTRGTIELSWSDATARRDYLVLHGSRGKLCVGWKEAVLQPNVGSVRAIAGGYDKRAAIQRQVENFAAAIRGREPLRADNADALASVEVIAAAYDAMRRR